METHDSTRHVTRMRLVGGNLAVDLVNTRSGPPAGPADDEALRTYEDLVGWGCYAGTLSEREAAGLLHRARSEPSAAEEALERALDVRETLDELFRSIALGRPAPAPALDRLGRDEAEAIRLAELRPGDGGDVAPFAWTWRGCEALTRPVWPAVHAAVTLLSSGDVGRVKACGGCRFLFVDESKNRSRRWCSMEDCGRAEKKRLYVGRRRARSRKDAGEST